MDEKTSNAMSPENRIKLLNAWSEGITIDRTRSAHLYCNSLEELIRRADAYLKQGQLEDAYMLYMRYAIIMVEQLLKHPGYQSLPSDIKKKGRNNLAKVIPKAEALKEQLLAIYDEEFKHVFEQKKEDELRRKEEDERLLKYRGEEEEKLRQRQSSVANYNNQIDMGEGVRESNIDRDVVKSVPTLPDNFLVYGSPDYKIPDTTPVNNSTARPQIDRSTKPAQVTSQNGSYKSKMVKPVIVPSSLMDVFLRVVESNTTNDIESCGFLIGKERDDRCVVTHLLIPKQTGDANSCVALHEEEIHAYQEKHDLYTFGWIHTHPSQRAFLSSIDLHTQHVYQSLAPETIAIVCAPSCSQTGIYQLTTDYGMIILGKCTKGANTFHQHPEEKPIFDRPEHFTLDESLRVEVVDLRLI